jgi:excisionase family DNA binding protein
MGIENIRNATPHQSHPPLAAQEPELDGSERPQLLACLLILPSDAEPIVSLLKRLADSCPHARALCLEAGSEPSTAAERWVSHSVAADYLGISKSTLYRYVSQQKIECRKMAGRLEYRESTLEKAKQVQIRPARFSLTSHDIILSTLNSGK